jgi:hypothetical protein
MKKSCLITTFYSLNKSCPSKIDLKEKFRCDCLVDDIHINYSDYFDPWNSNHLKVGDSKRKDLVYGKIFMLRDYIKENILGKYEIICHIDYNDVKFARSFIEMIDLFDESKKMICMATEKQCWPDIEVVSQWNPIVSELDEFHHINSGCILSKTEVLLHHLEKLVEICLNKKIDFWDDQGVWQYYNSLAKIDLDTRCEYFFCTALLDNNYFTKEGGKIKTKFGTLPYIIHDNSSFSLNLTQQI